MAGQFKMEIALTRKAPCRLVEVSLQTLIGAKVG